MQNLRHILVISVLLGLLSPLVAQKEASAKPDPEVAASLKEFATLVKDRKGTKDSEAMAILDQLLSGFEKMHPADKKAFTKGIADPLNSVRIKRKPTEANLFEHVIIALGKTGSHGSKYLAKAYENSGKFGKTNREWLSLKELMLEHLGKTKDQKFAKFLVDEALHNNFDSLMAKAGGAMANFADAKLSKRRDWVKVMVKRFSAVYEGAYKNVDPSDIQLKRDMERWRAIKDEWVEALQALTGQKEIKEANDWQRFWNKHKNENWDKMAGKSKKAKSKRGKGK